MEVFNSVADFAPLPSQDYLEFPSSASLGQLRPRIYDWGTIIRRMGCGRLEQRFSHTGKQIRQKSYNPFLSLGGGVRGSKTAKRESFTVTNHAIASDTLLAS